MLIQNKTTTISRRAFILAATGTLAVLTIPGLGFAKRQDQDQDADKDKVVDLKAELPGDDTQTWMLTEVKTKEKEYTGEHFEKNKEFEKSDLAQLVPSQLTLRADGRCLMVYASKFQEGKLVPDDYHADGQWAVDAKDKKKVKLIEDVNGDKKINETHDEVIWLKDINLDEDHFTCKFSLQGDYTGGVTQLKYNKLEVNPS